MPSLCTFENCRLRASYALQFEKPIYCKKHGILQKAYPQTSICVCGSASPIFGLVDDTRPSCCVKCKSNTMIDKKNIKCIEENCNKRPNYGFLPNKPLYCTKHKKENTTDVVHKLCMEKNCTHRANFDINEGNGSYCVEHKKENMVDISNKKCVEINCNKRANFNYNGLKAEYCSIHKKENMIDINHSRCKSANCNIQPTFNFKNLSSPLYCNNHKLDGMINICASMCQHINCDKRATFGNLDDVAIYCLAHKQKDMVDVKNKRCPDCPLNQRGNYKYNNYCVECFSRKFPKDPRTFLIKKKSYELTIRDFLQINFPELNLIHDKPIWTHNCECNSRRRIDLRTLIGNTLLAIEIDERQHKDRNKNDENIRYDDLFMNYSGKWLYIRYNPNIYKDKQGRRQNPQLDKRLNILKNTVEFHIQRIKNEENIELLEIHKLFYDGYDIQ